MKFFTYILCLLVALGIAYLDAQAQGCVAIRQFSGVGNSLNHGELHCLETFQKDPRTFQRKLTHKNVPVD